MNQDLFDNLDDLRLTPLESVELLTTRRLKARRARRSKRAFVTVSWEWILRVKTAYPQALLVALAVKRKVDLAKGQEPVTIGGVDVDMPLYSLNRTLTAMEQAGIIRTERHPGRLARIWLLDKPDGNA